MALSCARAFESLFMERAKQDMGPVELALQGCGLDEQTGEEWTRNHLGTELVLHYYVPSVRDKHSIFLRMSDFDAILKKEGSMHTRLVDACAPTSDANLARTSQEATKIEAIKLELQETKQHHSSLRRKVP